MIHYMCFINCPLLYLTFHKKILVLQLSIKVPIELHPHVLSKDEGYTERNMIYG